MNVAIHCDTSNSASLVQPSLGRLTGNGCIHFADWQATTDGHELVDPIYAQYQETIVIVEIKPPDGKLYNYCPFIWVDQDIPLIRGLLPRLGPKNLVQLTSPARFRLNMWRLHRSRTAAAWEQR